MTELNRKIGYAGVALGACALLLALIHFWAGPFSPQPTLETVVAEKAAAIRESTIKALSGEEYKTYATRHWDADRVMELTVSLMGALAIILGIIAFIQKASWRLAGGAAVLGAGAIGFQLFTFYMAAVLVVILIAAVLSQIDISF